MAGAMSRITSASSIARMNLHQSMNTVENRNKIIIPKCPKCETHRTVGKIGTNLFFCSECLSSFTN